ncbi:hypothetical protein CCACVL1_24611 [Corchorus capsularis]|uniref:Uncharacterized protein n=1 Tax=Corchorus capsularis TaxID=210143 RepID=A0A1R3GNU6_COCAP|nr:hypothetical protein CCACVL1_24611 [Corchorus capsularis]
MLKEPQFSKEAEEIKGRNQMGNTFGLEDPDSGSYRSNTHCRRWWRRRHVGGIRGGGFGEPLGFNKEEDSL